MMMMIGVWREETRNWKGTDYRLGIGYTAFMIIFIFTFAGSNGDIVLDYEFKIFLLKMILEVGTIFLYITFLVHSILHS